MPFTQKMPEPVKVNPDYGSPPFGKQPISQDNKSGFKSMYNQDFQKVE